MEKLLLGAHTSTSGGLFQALLEGKEIGATTVQLFTANQRQWKSRPLAEDEIELFEKTRKETDLTHLASHASYLINLGSPHEDVREKSIPTFREEIIRCKRLGISYLVFHPGSALDETREKCLESISEALLQMKDLFQETGDLQLLLETTAGQGSVVGSTFEELSYIIERVKGNLPIGVCLDTCHIFAAGYDIRTKEALGVTLDKFDSVIGLEYLQALHLNDSQKGLGLHVDRHALLGEGEIKKECFCAIMQEPRLKKLPKYLETPGGPEVWKKEIAWLRSKYES